LALAVSFDNGPDAGTPLSALKDMIALRPLLRLGGSCVVFLDVRFEARLIHELVLFA
jgi:hypothetical protein